MIAEPTRVGPDHESETPMSTKRPTAPVLSPAQRAYIGVAFRLAERQLWRDPLADDILGDVGWQLALQPDAVMARFPNPDEWAKSAIPAIRAGVRHFRAGQGLA